MSDANAVPFFLVLTLGPFAALLLYGLWIHLVPTRTSLRVRKHLETPEGQAESEEIARGLWRNWVRGGIAGVFLVPVILFTGRHMTGYSDFTVLGFYVACGTLLLGLVRWIDRRYILSRQS